MKNGIAATTGGNTPTEIQYLMEYGLYGAKFFPAAQAGGLDKIKAIAAPFPQMRL